MRQYLLPQGGQFYKVNMHSHSTLSDGKQTPAELKEAYLARGYSAIAFTEHGKLHNLSHLSDDRFIAIVSYELDTFARYEPPFPFYAGKYHSYDHAEVVHLNLYARDPAAIEGIEFADIRKFSVENVNETIRRAEAAGFFVIYNHPNWSLNTCETYCRLKGLCGLELINGASQRSSDMDYTPLVYDQMLRSGQRLVCVAGDDNHNVPHFGTAWTMVKASKLSYDALIQGIETGNCYASDGPSIEELYVEDGTVHIQTSEAVGIFLTTAGRRKACALSENGAPLLTEAAFKLDPDDCYFRIGVRNAAGKHANTRAYFMDEIQ